MKVIGYTRVSSEDQDDRGVSLENQEATIREWCAKEGHELLGVFSEQVSGKVHHSKRKGLKQALALLPSDGTLVVMRRDRLYRKVSYAFELQEELEGRGCSVHSLAGDNSDDPLIRAVHEGVAERFRWDVANKTREALHRKRANGERTGGVPYGWEVDPDSAVLLNKDKTERKDKAGNVCRAGLRPVEGEQKALRVMRRLRGKGWGWRRIASELTRRSVPTKSGGGVWGHTSVKSILSRVA